MVGSEIKRRKEKDKRHKKTGDKEVLAGLIRRREAIRDLIEQETRKLFNLVKKERYIGGNIPGRFLAKALRKKKTSNYIDKIKTRTGDIRYKDKDIATTFQDYYAGLYAINKNETQEQRDQKREKIKSYLKDSGMVKIMGADQRTLEAPITEEEREGLLRKHRLARVLAQMG